MNIKWSRFASVLLLLGSIAIAWSHPVHDVMVPPGPPPWHSYPENIAALVLLVPASLLAGRWWYSLPFFFGFGTFLVVGPAVGAIGSSSYEPHDASFVSFLLSDWPWLSACLASGTLAAWLGFLSSRYAGTGAAVPNHALQRTEAGR